MAFRIVTKIEKPPPGRKRPRVVNNQHLAFIRKLPCVICATRPVDPAHLRAGCRLLGKRPVGVAEKPDDKWTIPACRNHHDEQHAMGELDFWKRYNIDPFQLALALYAASLAEDLDLAETIVAEHQMRAMGLGGEGR